MEGWKPVQLRVPVIKRLDELKEELGVKGRSEVIEKLIEFYEERRGNDPKIIK